jgi:hypothetical protein
VLLNVREDEKASTLPWAPGLTRLPADPSTETGATTARFNYFYRRVAGLATWRTLAQPGF